MIPPTYTPGAGPETGRYRYNNNNNTAGGGVPKPNFNIPQQQQQQQQQTQFSGGTSNGQPGVQGAGPSNTTFGNGNIPALFNQNPQFNLPVPQSIPSGPPSLPNGPIAPSPDVFSQITNPSPVPTPGGVPPNTSIGAGGMVPPEPSYPPAGMLPPPSPVPPQNGGITTQPMPDEQGFAPPNQGPIQWDGTGEPPGIPAIFRGMTPEQIQQWYGPQIDTSSFQSANGPANGAMGPSPDVLNAILNQQLPPGYRKYNV